MGKKILAYLLIIIGLVGIAYYAVPQINNAVNPYLPEGVTDTYVIAGGIILFLLGVYILSKRRRNATKGGEVPIYHGNNVVGYRRN